MFESERVVCPGAEAGIVLESVVTGELSDAELIAYVQACDRQVSHATAVAWEASRSLAERTRERVVRDPESPDRARSSRVMSLAGFADRLAVHEVQQALRMSASAAAGRISRARILVEDLPELGVALRAGKVSVTQVLVFLDRTLGFGDLDVLRDLVARVVPRAWRQTPGDFGKSVMRGLNALAPQAQAERHRAARSMSGVSMVAGEDGMGSLQIRDSNPRLEWGFTVLDTLARAALKAHRAAAKTGSGSPVDNNGVPGKASDQGAGPDRKTSEQSIPGEGVDNNGVPRTPTDQQAGPDRKTSEQSIPNEPVDSNGVPRTPTLDNLRAEAFLCLLERAITDPTFPTEHGKRRVETQVVIDIETLMGVRNDPGTINGHSVPASIAREAAAGSTAWRRLVTDPVTGHLLDYGRSYEPPADLREFILARDAECRVPHCHTRASVCDLDHAIPAGRGGPSSTGNLGALCRSHHSTKTAGHTDLTASGSDGAGIWVTVLGNRVFIPPRPVLDDQRRVSTVSADVAEVELCPF